MDALNLLNLTPFQRFLYRMITGTEKSSKSKCDVILIGKDLDGERVLEALQALGRDQDFHIISDKDISPKRLTVTSQAFMSSFEGSGRN